MMFLKLNLPGNQRRNREREANRRWSSRYR